MAFLSKFEGKVTRVGKEGLIAALNFPLPNSFIGNALHYTTNSSPKSISITGPVKLTSSPSRLKLSGMQQMKPLVVKGDSNLFFRNSGRNQMCTVSISKERTCRNKLSGNSQLNCKELGHMRSFSTLIFKGNRLANACNTIDNTSGVLAMSKNPTPLRLD